MVGALFILLIGHYVSEFGLCAVNCPPRTCICLGSNVDCSDNKTLTMVPPNIPAWVEMLDLSNNSINYLDSASFKDLPSLTELRLSKNRIATVSKDSFNHLQQLKILELNRNQIRDIEALTFTSLEQLSSLRLKRNRISQLKDGAFFGLRKIKSLMLDFNSIQIISKTWLYGLDNLKELTISNNIVNHIEVDAWEFCQDLADLDLSNNRMKSIKKDTFKYLNLLQKLVLNNNNITVIEENAFEHLPNLRILQLNNNKISWTIEDASGVFSSLTSLNKFYLASNDIKSINKNAFKGLSKVVYLNLNNNNITSIQKNAFMEMPSLKDILLNTTSLLCDCNLQWFSDWLMVKDFKIRTICLYPEWLRGQPLLKVPVNNFTCDDLPKPRLIEEPEPEIMALKGENISLSCKAMSSASGPMSFIWKKDNEEILNGDISINALTLDGKHTETTSVLNIYKVQHHDAGKYQCVVSNMFGTTYSQRASISVLIFPTFVKIPHNVTVHAGAMARLECAAHGEPQPEIAWQKDGGNDFPAARERRMHVMPTDDVFFIMKTKLSDMGVYSCTANNAAGTIVANATLIIEEIPSFVKPMEDKDITAGESVVLQCMASGAPKPSILWLKDGDPIMTTERHFLTAEDQLMIIVDTDLSDAGKYQCQLNNSLGIEIGYSVLHVKPSENVNTTDVWGIVIITVASCAVLTSLVWVIIIYQTRKKIVPPGLEPPTPLEVIEKMHFTDNGSEHSSCKDSGTGDSAKRSTDDLAPGAEEYTLIINEHPGDGKIPSIRTASLIYMVTDGSNSHIPLLHKDGLPYSRSTNHERLEEVSGTPERQDDCLRDS